MSEQIRTTLPARNVLGTARLPGDKSISHRYAILSALASGTSVLRNYATGADCASTLSCIEQLGARVSRDSEGAIHIDGRERLAAPVGALDCGNSGSTMRMLAGVLAGHDFASELRGDESLSRRPMRRVTEPLSAMGAIIESADGRPPLKIRGGNLRGIDYTPPVASAQVKSSVLLAGLFAEGETVVREPVPTRDHTELALRAFGVQLSRKRSEIRIRGGQSLKAVEFSIPGDLSSAAFILCAAALYPESNLVIEGMLMNPTRGAFLDVLMGMGLRMGIINMEEQNGELAGTVNVRGGRLRGCKISGASTAALIDELPVLAAIAPYTENGIEIRDAGELRVKESDRIAAVSANLRAMGVSFEELEDGWRIPGGQQPRGAELDSFGDHRIAMAFSVAALRAQGESHIREAGCVGISFPEFFTVLDRITQR